MATDLQTDLSALIRKCECAIRRGTVPQPDKLHTLQQQLVTARDAPTSTRTEEVFQTAMQYYEDQIPEDVRRTDLAALTEAFERLDGTVKIADEEGTPRPESTADD